MGKRSKGNRHEQGDIYQKFNTAVREERDLTISFMKQLLDQGFDIHYRDDLAIRQAVNSERADADLVVQYLIDNGANVHAYNDQAIKTAIEIHNLDVARILIKNGVDVRFITDRVMSNLIEDSDNLDNLTFLKELIIEKGVDFRVEDNLLFHTLVGMNYDDEDDKDTEAINKEKLNIRAELLTFILRSGIDAGTLDHGIIAAADNYDFDTVFLIARYGGNIHISNNRVLCRSSYSDSYLDITKRLVEEFDADVNDNNGFPLRISSSEGMPDTVKYLVEHGANINVDDDYPIRIANVKNHFEIVKYLYQHGANVFEISSDEDTEISRKLKSEQEKTKNTLEERPEELGLPFDEINLGKLVGDYYAPMQFSDSKHVLSQIHALGFDHVNSSNIGKFRDAVRKAYSLLK